MEEELVQLTEQKLFYKDRVQALFWIVAAILAITILLVGLVLVLFKKMVFPPQIYFPATELNQIIPALPLDEAGIETNVLLTAVVEAMNSAHTFNFMNYTRRMEKVKSYFSKEGYQDYVQSLTRMGLLQVLVQNKLVVFSMPLEVPEILKEGPLANRYLWKIKVPMQFNFRNVATQRIQQFEITLLLVRVPTSESPIGINIYKYEIREKQQ